MGSKAALLQHSHPHTTSVHTHGRQGALFLLTGGLGGGLLVGGGGREREETGRFVLASLSQLALWFESLIVKVMVRHWKPCFYERFLQRFWQSRAALESR